MHFFLVGRVLEQENIDWLHEIIAAGHAIGNHTYDHVNVTARKIGDIQFRAQRLDEAGRSFTQALQLQPDHVRGRIGLAKVLLSRKEYQQALDELERAVRVAPEDEAIHYNLMLAYRNLKRPADAQRAYAEFQKIKARQEQSRVSVLNQLKGPPGPTKP